MSGPYGMGESYHASGGRIAPVLTWDGKILPLVAWMGGTERETRKYLKRDGLYDQFLSREVADYRRFKDKAIHGTELELATPTARVPKKLTPFSAQIRPGVTPQ